MLDGPLFRFSGTDGRTLLSAAIYRGPGPILFVWLGRRVFSWALR
jgi:hypothetical protein